MSDVIQFTGNFKQVMKFLTNRKFKKQLSNAFSNDIVRLRLERVDDYDEQMFG